MGVWNITNGRRAVRQKASSGSKQSMIVDAQFDLTIATEKQQRFFLGHRLPSEMRQYPTTFALNKSAL